MNNPSLYTLIKEKILLAYSEFLNSVENIKVIGIINIGIIIVSSIVFYTLSSIIFILLSRKYESFKQISKPLKRFVFYILFFLLWEEIPGSFASFMSNLSIFIALIKLMKIMDYFIVDVLMVKHYRTDVLQIFRDIIKAVIWIIMGMILIKTLFGFSIKDIAITSAVATAAIGFAFQDTLVNLISGVSIIAEKSFKIGDIIELKDGEIGTVLQINWRTTRIKNRKNQVIIVPNKELASAKIIHYNLMPNIARIFTIGLPYNTEPVVIKKEILSFLKTYDDVLKDPEPEVILTNFKDYFIEYQVRFFTNNIKDAIYLEDKIKTGLWYMLKRKGINIPFPIINVINQQESNNIENIYGYGENLINYIDNNIFLIKTGSIILFNEKNNKEILEFKEGECLTIEDITKKTLIENFIILTPRQNSVILKLENPSEEQTNNAKNNNIRILEILDTLYKINLQKEQNHTSSFMNLNWEKWK
ncbi:MAG TPA: mechanosensitive ion channel [Spirochaetota bacterium]|nr:mechanosensitive ion channel [Spirochaetota bacterium]HOM38270.1 mechanosensitive ion channel [Spirochaetota bacterium]